MYVKVVDKCFGEKEEILLSLSPEDINSDIGSGAWAEGNVLLAAVEEEEDHGYLMETGVKGFKAFLPKKNMKITPSKGELMFCKIQKISPTAVTLTAFKKNEPVKIETVDVPNLKTLVPGSLINFNIARIMKNGLEGLIYDGSIAAYVNEMYLPTKISMTDNQIIGKEVKARILYTMPLSNQLFVTLIVDDPAKQKKTLPFGTLIEEAKVIKQTSGGILLKLNSNDHGFLPRRVIVKNLKNNFDIDSTLIKYSPNSIHSVRVMDFNLFENCYLCTNESKLIDEKFFGTHDLEIGQLVQAKIEEKLSDGYRLKIGNIRAFMKGIFLDKSAKLNLGDVIRVRVAEIDHDCFFAEVTNLQGFIKDTAMTLTSKKQIKFNESFTGVVLNENKKFFTILFFNHFKGHLPKTAENEADIVSLGGLKAGSVKNFEVKTVKSDRITLSLPKKVNADNLGKIYECKVTAVLPSGLQIFIDELKSYGRLPSNFLSEFSTLSPLIHSQIKENDKFEVVALTNNLYSRRDVNYYRQGAVIDFNDVVPGDVLRCFVKSVDSIDVNTVTLECPLKNLKEPIKLNRNAFDDPENVILNPDDIVYVYVIAKNESHRNSLYVTPALHKVWKNDMNTSLEIAQSFMRDNQFLMEKMRKAGKPFGQFNIGQRISGNIKNIIGNNLLLDIKEGMFAQGTVDNAQSFKVGGEIKDAVIVWLDPVQQMIHVTLKDKCKEEISVDQKVDQRLICDKKHKAIIVYFNDFVTVCTIRKAAQPLVYAPTKFHFNDFSPSANRALGNATSKLVIKSEVDGKLFGVFVQDSKVFTKMEKLKSKLNMTVTKRKLDDHNESQLQVEKKKLKVVLEASDDEERKTETEDSEEDTPPKIEKSKKPIKGKKFGKSLKGKKSTMKHPMKPRKFINKDSLFDEKIVKLVSYKKMNRGEAKSSKKPARGLKKSMIDKKAKR